MVNGGHDAVEVCVVDDVLRSLVAEGVVERNAVQRLRDAREVCLLDSFNKKENIYQ
jgi:hypothetical protein